MMAWLQYFPSHQTTVSKVSLEAFTLPIYFPIAQPHDFRINIENQTENYFQKVLIFSEGVRNQ